MDRIGLPLPWGIIPAERLFRVVVGDDPAAGAETSVTVPGGVVWHVKSAVTSFLAAAAVANRVVSLVFDDGARVFAQSSPSDSIAAGENWVRLSWGLGQTYASAPAGGVRSHALPDMLLLSGARVRTLTTSLQPADDFGPLVLYVAEYEIRGLERGVAKYLEALARAGAEG